MLCVSTMLPITHKLCAIRNNLKGYELHVTVVALRGGGAIGRAKGDFEFFPCF